MSDMWCWICMLFGLLLVKIQSITVSGETCQAKTLLTSELHYLAEECTEEMHARIASSFIELVTQHLGTTEGGVGNEKCAIENVQVECGERSIRLRRSDIVDSKQFSKVPLTLKFAVKVPLPSNAFVVDLNQTTQEISSDLVDSLNETDLTLNISGVVLEYDESNPPLVRLVGLFCDKGQILKGTHCVSCPPGYYLDTSGCQACAVDQYQNQYAQTSCVPCPSGTSTLGQVASKRSEDCRDNTPPSFNNTCPGNKVFYTGKCSSYRILRRWKEPMATDNSGHVSISYPAIRPPVNLRIGLYNVLYSAIDSSGNRANCTFVVQVARKSCPVLHPPIHGSIASFSCGPAFGSQASLTCNTGYQMAGSSLRSCRADGTWSGNVTTCNIIKCPSIQAPSYGTVSPSACQIPSGVNYRTECSFICNVTVGYQLEGAPKVSCLESGSWSGDTTRTICRDIQAPSITCPPNVDNITTEPGQSYAIVTWQIPVLADNSNETLKLDGLRPPQKLNVGKANITYEVTDSSGLSRSCVFFIQVKDHEPPKIADCPHDIHKMSKKKWMKIFFPAVTVTDNVGVHLFTTSRPNGSEFTWGKHNVTYTASDLAGNTAKCHFQIIIGANCSRGSYYNKTGCQACAVDQYQDQEAQTFCFRCPPGTSTLGQVASKSRTDCHEKRKPGSSNQIPMISGTVAGAVTFITLTIVVFVRKRCLRNKRMTYKPVATMSYASSETSVQIENEVDQDSPNRSDETPHNHLPTPLPKYITKLEASFTSTGGELSASSDSNVRIIVPKGAIPAGINQPVFFGVFFDETPLLQDIPEAPDKTIISPVVECGPHDINLKKPVEIIVPHCLCLSEAKKEWIIVYRCGNFSAEFEGRLSWEKVPTKSKKNSQSSFWFKVEKDSIRIKTKTFSLWSIFACGGPRRKRATVFASKPDPRSDLIYLRFYVYSDNEDSKKRVELKDRERFPDSKPAKEEPFRMYNDNKVITVKLTDLEKGWEFDKTNDTQTYHYERASGNGFRSKKACDFAVKPEDGRDVNGFSCMVKFHQEDDDQEYSIYLNPGFTPLKRQSIRENLAAGSQSATVSSNTYAIAGCSTSTGPEEEVEEEGCVSHNQEGQSSPDSSREKGYVQCDLGDDKPVTESLLFGISPYVGVKWKPVLRKLSTEERIIRNLDEDYKKASVEEKCYQGLLAWRDTQGSQGATIKTLYDALCRVGCSEALKALQREIAPQNADC